MTPGCAGRATQPDLHQHSRCCGERNHGRGAGSGQASFAKCRYRAPRNAELLMLPEPLFLVARSYTEHGNTKRVGGAREVMPPDLGGAWTNETREVLTARIS